MKFLFLVGVEGCGHSMIRSVLSRFFGEAWFVDEGDWHEKMTDFWKPDASLRDRLKGRKKIEKSLSKYLKQGYTHLFDSASFPFDQPRNSLRRFDLVELADILIDYMEIRLLVPYRNPISATFSGIRRGFTKHPYEQCKIVEDNLIFLNSQLSQLRSDIYRKLAFEEFLLDPWSHIGRLASWWDLEETELAKGCERLRSPTRLEQIPKRIRRCLEDFFTISRLQQWPLLTSQENYL
ncbi:MAG: hypothetical protein JW883_02675 [Deltaproteobacteria bacterium]|nr:hypothetical protein [Deltaproteobacteria bacterium]